MSEQRQESYEDHTADISGVTPSQRLREEEEKEWHLFWEAVRNFCNEAGDYQHAKRVQNGVTEMHRDYSYE